LLKAIAITQAGERVRLLVELPPDVLNYNGPKQVE
jgi:hypothetical protein